jgi:hypothetical protein
LALRSLPAELLEALQRPAVTLSEPRAEQAIRFQPAWPINQSIGLSGIVIVGHIQCYSKAVIQLVFLHAESKPKEA